MKPKLTIVSITYNQENFIKQALDSFIMQKTDFQFEVIISDDCSKDNTGKIIEEYAKKYPDIIKPVFQKENVGAIKNFVDTLALAKSEYVIVNEGDDYFTDPYKLQKQVDFLEANTQYSGCFHPVKVIYEDSEKNDEIFPSKRMIGKRKVITLNDLLEKNYIQTNSMIYRWRFAEENILDYFPDNILPGDLYLHMLHAQKGDIALMPDVMSVYRKHAGGIWCDAQNNIEKLHLKHGLKEINFLYNVYKNITNSSEEYLNEKVLPSIRNIMDIFYKNKKFCELEKISSQYPEIYNLVFEKYSYFSPLAKKKLKKYKKLFKIALIFAIFFLILNLLALLHYIF